MRVPTSLANGFGEPFEKLIRRFAAEQGLLPEEASLSSERFLARSVVPHVRKLSSLFNRLDEEGETTPEAAAGGLDPYWKRSSNPANLRLAYFLYFMPSNLFRVAAIWSELARLGYRWPEGLPFRGLELGAGPASGACGIAAGERHAEVGLPRRGDWALIEQDKATLELGARWAAEYFRDSGLGDWGTRTFARRIDLEGEILPRSAPRFSLWLMSYFLNESSAEPVALARKLLHAWRDHLTDEGLVILVEPALRLQSRRLLELRRALLEELAAGRGPAMQVLLPCLGHQACGALSDPDDWCHEEVAWWRPPYFRVIDRMAGLDRRTLPFSYLVLARTRHAREKLLPALAASPAAGRERLVSPAHTEGRDYEFFICGEQGKRRARYRPEDGTAPERGDVLLGAETRGAPQSVRVQTLKTIG
jgi:hypothetical protein